MGVFDVFEADREPVEDVAFIHDTHRRRLVALLVDTSASMASTQLDGERAIDVLNRELARWLPTVRAEGQGNLRDVEFLVVTFGAGGVRVVSGDGDADPSAEDGRSFVRAAALRLDPLPAGGATPMTGAVDLAVRLLEDRRLILQTRHGLQTGRPRLILISDGAPTDDEGNPTDRWRELAERLAGWRRAGRLQLFAFGVPGVDDDVMRALATAGCYFRLDELDVRRLLDLILVATSEHEPLAAVWNRVLGDEPEDGDT